ncbi:HvfC/BufC N-terminal domain-containing protein [Sphingomonas sp. PAMC 26621]|uniref:HvfC/BufC N-terminal domain-containing protein n=1 Tax=Sphingomonas sp. PAMC 26621 TaxID=1112213 RepID=UPI0002894779|nr:DNA-binding domain-containing protein [Sphingomonas sp. PAMC 26621]
MSLLALQRTFVDFLLDQPTDLPVAVSGSAGPGLAVYHNAYRAQLVACLKDSYERLWAWLGDDAFASAARHHIDRHAPTSWTLSDYGVGFAETINALYPDDPEVAEIAALDWALRRAFDGADAAPFAPARLIEIDWDDAVIHFVPTLALLPVKTNCGAIWTAIAASEDVPAARILPQPAWVRVWRVDMQPHFATIEATETDAIRLAATGESFARLCDHLAETIGMEEAVLVAGRCLSSWLQDGLIADIRQSRPLGVTAPATGDRA